MIPDNLPCFAHYVLEKEVENWDSIQKIKCATLMLNQYVCWSLINT